jgi:hypothetical protein
MAVETIRRIEEYGPDGIVAATETERIAGAVEYRHYDAAGSLDEQRPATADETAQHAAWEQSQEIDELRAKIRLEIDQNKQFLALDPPTNAQNAQQIQNLTRQSSGVMRQLIGFYDDLDAAELEP